MCVGPRTCASPHPVPTMPTVAKVDFSVTVARHTNEIKPVENVCRRDVACNVSAGGVSQASVHLRCGQRRSKLRLYE